MLGREIDNDSVSGLWTGCAPPRQAHVRLFRGGRYADAESTDQIIAQWK